MTEPDPVELELNAARTTYPVGDHIAGTVTQIPRPGAIGLFVDLGQQPTGFVDVLHLPRSVDQWPAVGTVTQFEVLQHQRGQVRLFPLDAGFRSDTARLPMTEPEWRAFKNRHPLESEVTAEVIHVFPANHEYVVTVDGLWCGLPWIGPPPTIGTIARFVVNRHLDATRRILLRST